ncbi:TPA: type IV pilin protein [Neisseria meningitidis]|uniref:Pilin n=1 Tax=Neisseria meningitidis serogroup A / serotype 4A (strain DSM 15465 / Z2491) TaxID=122587 RepID=A0A0U1RHU2_NEIMA|nr:type IV pilin protein [Neisseria meningitidis]ARB72366.1 type IV pilin protein [Neisseria meningitidis]ARC09335.1 type IV pilin protein [Neisseria meningitidis]ELK74210.1 prepilin-type N-terminal cleavage/methylation domain protein [Neisseria meningitidis 63041]ELL11167.1 prepilin-type N-terminal cleavage/methylation domain protein [Neisseria meningitidis 65014]ELL32458.1 prepilin-type N-terminal cleavage/methylation domain protein [Neisseria meningitidis 63006]
MKNVQKGFTLLELMIAVAILGILTLITYPSYKTYIRRVRLSEVKSTLLMNAQTMERYYRQKGTFATYDKNKLKQNEYFKITLSEVSPDHFTLQAVPDPATNEGETCIVTLNDGGTLSAAGNGQSCPDFD